MTENNFYFKFSHLLDSGSEAGMTMQKSQIRKSCAKRACEPSASEAHLFPAKIFEIKIRP